MTEPRSARRVAVAGARAAGATIGLGVALLAVGITVFAPLPQFAVTPARVTVVPVATPQQLVCPGAVLRLGDDQGQSASIATSVGPPSTATGATSGDVTSTPFGTDLGSPTLLESSAGADPTVTVSGSETQSVAAADISGFAAATCAPVSTDSWLVGGSTATGRTTLITLANPTDVASTVSLDIYDGAGAVTASGATGIEVDPGSQRVLSLAGFTPGTASPVVHVTSEGGHIVANLQQSVTRGLETAGVDIVGTTSDPSLLVVVPGLVVLSPDDIENRIQTVPDSDDLKTIARLYVPGTTDATATINVAPEDGAGTGVAFNATLAAGVVTDVPIEGLSAGSYTVSIATNEPVVGAVRVSTVSSPDVAPNTSDFAWLPSPTAVSAATAFTVADGPSPTLHVANPSATAIDVTLSPGGGAPQQVSVAARSSVSLPVTVATTYGFSASAPVLASLGYSSTNQLADVAIAPRLADADPLTVYP